MSRDFSLQPLLDLMHERADEATRQLGQLVAAEQDARSRLALLTQYREEYVQRFRDAQTQGLSLQAWQNYQDFIDKIDVAIAQQSTLVDSSAQQTAAGQERWKTQNKKLKAIDTLALRHQKTLLAKDAKQEQKQLDEHATRHYPQNGKVDIE